MISPHSTADSEVLQTLDLSWNHIRKKGVVALAAGLKVSPQPWPVLCTIASCCIEHRCGCPGQPDAEGAQLVLQRSGR